MINGPCAGAGLSFAGACDLRFASEGAIFTSAFTRVGLCGDFGGTWFWTQILGTAANEALDRSMIRCLYQETDLRAQTLRIAHELADGPRWAYAYAKDNLNAAEDGTLDRVLQVEAITQGLSGRTTRQAGFKPSSVPAKSR